MNNALFSSLIESADRLDSGGAGFFQFLGGDLLAGVLDKGAGAAAVDAVLDAAFFVLLVALDLGLNVSQGLPPKFPVDEPALAGLSCE